MARYDTATDLINRVAVECGLSEIALPFSSTDPAFKQLVKLLTGVGQELVALHPWTQLQKSGSIATTGSPNQYDVPEDYLCFIDQTGWDTQNSNRLAGSVSPQTWSILINEPVVATLYLKYREAQDQFWLYPTDTPSGLTLPYEYIRRTWAVNGTTYKDYADNPSDVVMFEPLLVVRLLKLRFLEARGFDSTKAQDQFILAFETYVGKNASAPVLGIIPRRRSFLLDDQNLPDTGFGS